MSWLRVAMRGLVTAAMPLLLALSKGRTRKSGHDFDSIALNYQFARGNT